MLTYPSPALNSLGELLVFLSKAELLEPLSISRWWKLFYERVLNMRICLLEENGDCNHDCVRMYFRQNENRTEYETIENNLHD